MAIMAENVNQKPGYKLTEIGMIPEDWKIKRLEELGYWKGGTTPSMANDRFWINGSIYWASSGDIKTKLLSKTANTITEIAVKLSSTTLLQEGAILIVTRSGILRKYLPVAKNTVPMAINQDIKALIPNGQVSADYLLQILSERGPDILSTCMKSGTTVESVEYIWLKKYQISLPPLPEQQAIATALSDVDALITSLYQLITKKRDIKQATMQQLLTGKRRLPGFNNESNSAYKHTEVGMIPQDWEVKKLGDAADFFDGRRRPINERDRAKMRGQYPYYGASGVVDYVDDYLFDEELILLGEDGENILSRNCKLAFRVSGKIWVNNHAHVLKPKANMDVNFLTEYLESLDYEQYNTGTAQPKLNKRVCLGIIIFSPPLTEQQAIATVLSDMDAEIAALEQKREKTHMLKQGMMQELLTGKTRLI